MKQLEDNAPTGGLAEVALKPAELGSAAKREIRLLIDTQLSPPIYYPSAYDLPGKSPPKVLEADPVASFKSELSRIGGEAAIYLAFSYGHRVAFVKMVRFPTEAAAEMQWSKRQNGSDSKVVTVGGRQILVTEGGHFLRPGLRANGCMVEAKAGRYWVRTAGAPTEWDPGLQLVFKQLEKVEKLGEPAARPSSR